MASNTGSCLASPHPLCRWSQVLMWGRSECQRLANWLGKAFCRALMLLRLAFMYIRGVLSSTSIEKSMRAEHGPSYSRRLTDSGLACSDAQKVCEQAACALTGLVSRLPPGNAPLGSCPSEKCTGWIGLKNWCGSPN